MGRRCDWLWRERKRLQRQARARRLEAERELDLLGDLDDLRLVMTARAERWARLERALAGRRGHLRVARMVG